MRMRILAVTAMLIAAFGVSGGAASPASASAYGCDSWSAFTIASLPTPVPRGFLCHRITGSGASITHETVHWETVPGLCNSRVDRRYTDTSGYTYKVVTGTTYYDCRWSIDLGWSADWTARYGTACAYLYTNSKYVTKQCHSITR